MHELRLRPVTMADAGLLLEWRNDPVTRANSHHSSMVETSDHDAWLRGVIQSPDRFLYLAMLVDVPIGMVRADVDHEGATLSWSIAPEHRGVGLARPMLLAAMALHQGPFRAEIKVTNLPSIRVAESVGFHLEWENGGVRHYRC